MVFILPEKFSDSLVGYRILGWRLISPKKYNVINAIAPVSSILFLRGIIYSFSLAHSLRAGLQNLFFLGSLWFHNDMLTYGLFFIHCSKQLDVIIIEVYPLDRSG